ncbi:MAG: glycosyltransferase family 2 protein [Acidobacteriota bacterium]
MTGDCYALAVLLSITIITFNEEKNIGPTLDSVAPLVRELGAEVIVVDSGSTDRTVELARAHGAQVFVEEWKGYGAQKNSAVEKASGEWILSLDADEMVSPELALQIGNAVAQLAKNPAEGKEWCLTHRAAQAIFYPKETVGFFMPRTNFFLSRWIKHGGFWPDRKLRLFRRGTGRFEERPVHETVQVTGATGTLSGALIHQAYPTLTGYINQMNRYSSLGAEIANASGPRGFSLFNIVLRPVFTFLYNYFLRLGFLDGREGLLLHLYHAAYVSWKYAKAWELGRQHGPAARA